ncbi:MAG: BACON domain-containing protein [Bacteroidaceae bacterium]|nr:BACON domain-containing protein [Bacteroidaceae bacterium]
MKLKHIFSLVLAAQLAIGCSDDNTVDPLGSITLDQTYVSIPKEGGDVSVTIKAQADWAFDKTFNIGKDADGNAIYAELPAWLSADKLSGAAGETVVTFHAGATTAGREAELRISTGADKQFLKVRQGSMEASDATCADIIAGPEGKTYRVTGAVTRIAGAQYGNFDITDETGTVYVYGIYDKDGKKGNYPLDGPTGWGIELGDIVTLEGPKQLHGTTVELVDATVIEVVKSLLKVVTPEQTVGIEGADVDVKLAYKGSGAYVQLPEDCDWISVTGEDYVAGQPTLFEPNPADTAIVHLRVAPNTGAGRKATLSFSSSNASSESTIAWTLKQDAFTLPHGESADDPFTVEEAVAKCLEIGNTTDGEIYYAHGFISSIKEVSPSYGNATFNISDDGTDENALTVFRSKWLENAAFTAEDQIGLGDEVIIRGKLVYYKDKYGVETPEFSGDVYVVSHKAAGPGSRLRPFTADEANAFVMENLEPGQVTDDYYYIAGEITNIAKESDFFNAKYGNASFYIADDDDPSNEQFYVFRTLYLGNRKWVEGDTQIKVGDQVVICGRLTKYQDKNGNIIPETFNGKIDDVSYTPYIFSLNGKRE